MLLYPIYDYAFWTVALLFDVLDPCQVEKLMNFYITMITDVI